jgi:hypothetical protein
MKAPYFPSFSVCSRPEQSRKDWPQRVEGQFRVRTCMCFTTSLIWAIQSFVSCSPLVSLRPPFPAGACSWHHAGRREPWYETHLPRLSLSEHGRVLTTSRFDWGLHASNLTLSEFLGHHETHTDRFAFMRRQHLAKVVPIRTKVVADFELVRSSKDQPFTLLLFAFSDSFLLALNNSYPIHTPTRKWPS